MNEETNIEQLSDNDTIEVLPNEYMTIREYAESVGQSYENVRKKVAKIKDSEEYKDNIKQYYLKAAFRAVCTVARFSGLKPGPGRIRVLNK